MRAQLRYRFKKQRRLLRDSAALRRSLEALLRALCATASLTATGRAEAPPTQPTAIAEFRIRKGGDMLALPVTVGDVSYPFLVDLSGMGWHFDLSLLGRLKARTESAAVAEAEQPARRRAYISPPLRLGPLDLGPKNCNVWPGFHEGFFARDHESFGLLGTDTLTDKVFTIDFDNGVFRFLKEAEGDLGVPIPLKRSPGGLAVVAEIEGLGSEEFCISTMNFHLRDQFYAGALRTPVFDKLLTEGRLRLLRSEDDEEARRFGLDHRLGRIGRISLGRFTHIGLVMESTGGISSILGLGYLSRYVVTIDGPGLTMYLRPGRNFDRRDRYDLSGLRLTRQITGEAVISRVAPNSPAEAAGLRKWDEIIAIDGARATETTLFKLAGLLALPGRRRVITEKALLQKETILVLEEPADRAMPDHERQPLRRGQ